MSRRRKAAKRAHLPDARYGSPLVSQLINVVMKSGKKSIAQGIVYGAIEKVSEKLMKGNPVELLLGALENCRPKLEVKSRRVGGATYQVPVEVSHERQNSIALRWVVLAAQGRKGSPMAEALASEIVDAARRAMASGLRPEELDERAFERFLYTAGQPDPDLLIRTSGEQRLSNFLLWQCAYSELVFVPIYWPDFDRQALDEAVAVYRQRERRFGGLAAKARS